MLHIISHVQINQRNYLMKRWCFETRVVAASHPWNVPECALMWEQQSVTRAPRAMLADVLCSSVSKQEKNKREICCFL